ncbi:MAG: hypothetical protein HXX11_14305 [Desulfuromonadales bacterium]|nr:hypothetical protein [Desulfuromonadales bacterium]
MTVVVAVGDGESLRGYGVKLYKLHKFSTRFNLTGVAIGIIGISQDITSRKEVEVAFRHDSTHDSLPDLYNRLFSIETMHRNETAQKEAELKSSRSSS